MLTLVPSGYAQNLVQNPGFETGDFTDWTLQFTSATGVETAGYDGYQPHSGRYFAALGSVGHDTLISQNIATAPGTEYQVSYYFASDGGTPNDFSASFAGQLLYSQTNIPTQPWTLYTYDVVVTDNTSTLLFGERNNPTYLALDDISVTAVPEVAAVPEPGTQALPGPLALASAGFLARRRNR